mmetsp:Transcript_36174/g.99704  ORF Transcript_36174/g.99704 Transcript_36174/m.99704 type:complete len:215 (-) Transcript_36174:231-875(-)
MGTRICAAPALTSACGTLTSLIASASNALQASPWSRRSPSWARTAAKMASVAPASTKAFTPPAFSGGAANNATMRQAARCTSQLSGEEHIAVGITEGTPTATATPWAFAPQRRTNTCNASRALACAASSPRSVLMAAHKTSKASKSNKCSIDDTKGHRRARAMQPQRCSTSSSDASRMAATTTSMAPASASCCAASWPRRAMPQRARKPCGNKS